MKKTKVVCTIGPASETYDILKNLVQKGMNVARLNFSHGNQQEHQQRIEVIKRVREDLEVPLAIMLDTKGPEIRTGKFKVDKVELQEGDSYIITTRDVLGDQSMASVTYKGIIDDLEIGDKILIDDGLVSLKVEGFLNETDIQCTVENNGEIKDHKGVNLPGVKTNLPPLTEKDIDDIKFGIRMGVDFIAASFVRKAEDVLEIKAILEENGGESIQIIPKIENQEGVDNLDAIIEVSDGIMVARGDLGVEVPTEDIALIQKDMIARCNAVGKPVITATQMLDSMIRNPRPTRAEVTDVSNAILDGSDAIMLSGETAAGKYPEEAVKTMATIAVRTEESIDYGKKLKERGSEDAPSVTDAISYATCTTAMDLEAAAIITATSSGHTARMVSKFRPSSSIIAATTKEHVRRQLSLSWGVYSMLMDELEGTDDIINLSVMEALRKNHIQAGDLVVITAGVPVGVSGTTNLIKVHVASEILLSGKGIGKQSITGRAIVVNSNEDLEKVEKGDILVSYATNRDYIEAMERAGAVVVEEGGLTSHAAIVGLNLHKTTVVEVDNATTKLENGDIITVDGKTGLIYSGKSKVL
jgi:pyruvate kinase